MAWPVDAAQHCLVRALCRPQSTPASVDERRLPGLGGAEELVARPAHGRTAEVGRVDEQEQFPSQIVASKFAPCLARHTTRCLVQAPGFSQMSVYLANLVSR